MSKFDNYLREIVGTVAYWISPRGEVLPVATNHIDIVIKNPKKFGYTTEKIEEIYARHEERMGKEGMAREEIILDLLKHKWIRIRRYRNQGYSVNVDKVTKKIKDILFDWANKLLNKGIKGMKENDKFMPVNILGFSDHFLKRTTIQNVADDVLYESNESFDPENAVVIVESAEDFTYEPRLLDDLR